MASYIRRRKFLATLLGGAAVAWPFAARAQQRERVRRIGVLMNLAADDAVARARIGALQQQLGWIEGRNLHIDYRWTTGGDAELRLYAAELVALAPDVIVATGSPPVVALRQASRIVPIVFVLVADPVWCLGDRAKKRENAQSGARTAVDFNQAWGNITETIP